MTKKGRRASERRNEQDEPTKAARQGTKTDVTVVGTDLSGLKTSQGQPLEDRGALSETQESKTVGRSEISVRYGTETQTGQLDPDQEFRHAVLAADDDLPDTAFGDSDKSADTSFLNAELEVISGADADQRFSLNTYPTILGRANEACQVALTDTAISQTHLIFDYEALTGRWLITVSEDAPDGALLNGVRLEAQKNLSHGDVIRLGRSEVRFFYRAGVPEPRVIKTPSERTKEETTGSIKAFTGRFFGLTDNDTAAFTETVAVPRRPIKKTFKSRTFLSLIGVVLLLGGLYFLNGSRQQEAQMIAKEQVDRLLLEAQEDLKAQNIKDAKTKIESLLPWENKIPEVKSFQRMLKSEIASQAHLKTAQKKYDEDDIESMKTILAMIPDSSVFADDRDRLRAQRQGDEAAELRKTIKSSLSKRRFDEAEKKLSLYVSLWGEDETAKVLRATLKRDRGRAPPDSERMKQARELVSKGAYEAALKKFESIPLDSLERALQKQILKLNEALSQGRNALRQKSGSRALQAFTEAKALYGRITRAKAQTVFSRSLNQNLANAHYLVGATAYGKTPCNGAKHFWSAYQLVPDDLKVKARISQMRVKADQVFREASAESQLNPSAAKRKAKAALCLVPKGSELYQKLKTL